MNSPVHGHAADTDLREANAVDGERSQAQGSESSDVVALMHELQVHQIELEMSNEALRSFQLELQASRDRYQDLYEHAPVAYLTLNEQGAIASVNLTGEALFNADRAYLLNRPFESFVVPQEQARWRASFARLQQAPRQDGAEFALVRADGTCLHASLDCLSQLSVHGLMDLRVTVTDQTERKRAEDLLLKYREHLEALVASRTEDLRRAKDAAEAGSRAKSEFLSNISHEIRTPLNAVVGFADLMCHSNPTEVQRHRLGLIVDAALHLMGMLDDVLDIASLESGDLRLVETHFSVQSLLEDVRRTACECAHSKGLTIEVDPITFSPWVWGDAARLRQALLKYAENAVKFSDLGCVRLRALLLEEHGDQIMVRFEVQDAGIGVAPGQLPSLFEVFEQGDGASTRPHGGAGLGLAVASRLAALMGGAAGAQSELGRGSTFWFTARLAKAGKEKGPSVD